MWADSTNRTGRPENLWGLGMGRGSLRRQSWGGIPPWLFSELRESFKGGEAKYSGRNSLPSLWDTCWQFSPKGQVIPLLWVKSISQQTFVRCNCAVWYFFFYIPPTLPRKPVVLWAIPEVVSTPKAKSNSSSLEILSRRGKKQFLADLCNQTPLSVPQRPRKPSPQRAVQRFLQVAQRGDPEGGARVFLMGAFQPLQHSGENVHFWELHLFCQPGWLPVQHHHPPERGKSGGGRSQTTRRKPSFFSSFPVTAEACSLESGGSLRC